MAHDSNIGLRLQFALRDRQLPLEFRVLELRQCLCFRRCAAGNMALMFAIASSSDSTMVSSKNDWEKPPPLCLPGDATAASCAVNVISSHRFSNAFAVIQCVQKAMRFGYAVEAASCLL